MQTPIGLYNATKKSIFIVTMDKVKLYIQESYEEMLHRVTWPTWDELLQTGRIVFVSSIIYAFIVFLIDFIFGANPENPIFKGILYYVYQIFS